MFLSSGTFSEMKHGNRGGGFISPMGRSQQRGGRPLLASPSSMACFRSSNQPASAGRCYASRFDYRSLRRSPFSARFAFTFATTCDIAFTSFFISIQLSIIVKSLSTMFDACRKVRNRSIVIATLEPTSAIVAMSIFPSFLIVSFTVAPVSHLVDCPLLTRSILA